MRDVTITRSVVISHRETGIETLMAVTGGSRAWLATDTPPGRQLTEAPVPRGGGAQILKHEACARNVAPATVMKPLAFTRLYGAVLMRAESL